MKILWVSASAEWSVIDSSNGYRDALIRAGHELKEFKLYRRLVNMGGFLGVEPTVQNLSEVSRHASRTVAADALEFQPDLVLISSAMAFHPDAIVLLKRAGFRIGVIFTESPYSDVDQDYLAKLCDFAATNDKASADRYGWLYLPSAYSAEHHHLVDVDAFNADAAAQYLDQVSSWELGCESIREHWEQQTCRGCGSVIAEPIYPPPPVEPLHIPTHDVVLVGTGWKERVNRLKQVDWSGINLGIYGFWPQLDTRSDEVDFSLAAGLGRDEEGRDILEKHYTRRPTENAETVALYSGAKIVLNDHRAHPDAWSVGPRVYETLAVGGGLLLTDYRPELERILGSWMASCYVFTDAADLEAKIRYYLTHESERRSLVVYGRRCVQGETFDARVRTLMDAIGAREDILTAIG